jgi:Type IV secretory pathway, VirB6 components
MSHSKQRSEKVCLNCGAQLYDRYCHKCGQENVEPKQSLWHLIVHFFNDVTHFDGKFFATLKTLLFKPGFLSKEWVAGRRVSYLDPVRMYIFISTAFFIVLLGLLPAPHYETADNKELQHIIDSVRRADYEDGLFMTNDYVGDYDVFVLNVDEELRHGYNYYDSVKKARKQSRNFLEDYWAQRAAATYQIYDKEPYNFVPRFYNKLTHSLSKGYFISLPVFAFFLWLLYIRRKRTYYYVSHAIFAIHFYSVVFIFLLPWIGAFYLPESLFSNIVLMIIPLALPIYLFIAMQRFYGQVWYKTLIKYLLLMIAMTLALAIITAILLFNSMFYLSLH